MKYNSSPSASFDFESLERGSIRECLVNSTISYRNGFLRENEYKESRTMLTELSRLSSGYKKYLMKKLNK